MKKLNTLGDAFGRSNVELNCFTHWGRGAGRFNIGAGLASLEHPAGPLLNEAQGQVDLAVARSMAQALARSILHRTGKPVSPASIADATGDACLALARHRAAAVVVVPFGSPRSNRPASEVAAVAWAAVVASMADDNLGDAVPLHTVEPEWLYHNSDQSAETRAERLHRLKSERSRVLSIRALDGLLLDCYGRGRGPNKRQRGRVCVRLRRAVRLMLGGERLEAAAAAAGFKASGVGRGKASAGDRLLAAAKRLGFPLGVVRRGVHSVGPRPAGRRHVSGVDGTGDLLGLNVDVDGQAAAVRDGGAVPGFVPLDAARWDRVEGHSVELIPAPELPDVGRNSSARRARRAWIASEQAKQAAAAAAAAAAVSAAQAARQARAGVVRARAFRRHGVLMPWAAAAAVAGAVDFVALALPGNDGVSQSGTTYRTAAAMGTASRPVSASRVPRPALARADGSAVDVGAVARAVAFMFARRALLA